ncbi:MAG TPA: hypothetical protein VGJ14_01320 [Sporichthyaceae bacterium]
MATPPETAPGSTLADVSPPRPRRRARNIRRAVLGLLALVVTAGAIGALGVHTGSAQAASTDGWWLKVWYPHIARAGLDVEFRVQVHHDGGFGDKDITLAVSRRYFDIFETQGFHPDADKETSDGRLIYLTFDPPPSGDDFTVDYDAYIQPASQLGRHAELSLMDDQVKRLTVNFHTWLVP